MDQIVCVINHVRKIPVKILLDKNSALQELKKKSQIKVKENIKIWGKKIKAQIS